MTLLEVTILLFAALAAGSINGAVGSGSLVTLPILLWFGFDPATAITTNTIAMVSSAFGGVLAYRKEIKAEFSNIRPLLIMSILGGVAGSLLLLTTSPAAIRVVVPILIIVALLLVIFQPKVVSWVQSRPRMNGRRHEDNPYQGFGLKASLVGCAIYGGYFAAAQGILLLGVLGIFTGREMRRVNGVKNLLTLTVNITAALAFTIAFFTGHANVNWLAVAVMSVGAMFGGYFGGTVSKKLPPIVLRGFIVVVALAALTHEFLG